MGFVIILQSVNNGAEVLEDLRDLAYAVHWMQVVLAFVEVEHGTRLGLVFHKAMLDGVEIVVGATAGFATFKHTNVTCRSHTSFAGLGLHDIEMVVDDS